MTETIRRVLEDLAGRVRARHGELLDALTTVETHRTARTELSWTLAAFDPPPQKVAWLCGRAPVGSVYVASPATLPVYSFVLFALAPAVAGNRVVVRAASVSRHCAELMSEIACHAGLDITTTSERWVDFAAHACSKADGMVFAGSREHIQTLDAQVPEATRLIGQGPGVCAAVVTAAADLQQAARCILTARLFNSSQDCLATERVYVADDVFDEFLDALEAEADTVVLGENSDPDTDLGPLLIPSAAQTWYPHLTDMGRVVRRPRQVEGFLYDLAIVEATSDARVVLSETYCPILPVVRYKGRRQLQEMLAAGDFALGLTVFGELSSLSTLDFAHVALNQSIYDFEDAWAPFGGYRHTTLVRHSDHRRAGPALIPFELTHPAAPVQRL